MGEAGKWARRLATVIVASPAMVVVPGVGVALAADAYEVRITGLPDKFQAGAAQGGIMSVSATRLAAECSRVRALMLITLQGIDYGDLKVEVKTERGWEISPISRAGDNIMRAEDNWIDVNFLCQGQVRALQHRITFLAGAPTGPALIDVVVSSHGSSTEAGRAQATRPVVAGAPAPSPTRSGKTTAAPAPGASPSTVAGASGQAVPGGAEEPGPAAGRAERGSDQTRVVSSVVILAGGGVVTFGLAALLVVLLLLRRGRRLSKVE